MKGLKKIALVSAIAAASTAAHAELKAMDDSAMSAATGQAGITIDVNSFNMSIGEIQYKDEGSIFINGFKLGGAGQSEMADTANNGSTKATFFNDSLDNLKVIIDVVGDAADAATIQHGLAKIDTSVVTGLTGSYQTTDTNTSVTTTTTFTNAVAADLAAYTAATNGGDPGINDGDLVIGLDAQNQGIAVDMGMVIGSVVLGDSTTGYNKDSIGGDTVTTGSDLATGGANTVLMADTFLGGGIGPIDIVIDGQNGGMDISAYFSLRGHISLPFIATKFGFALHNNRGNDSLYTNVATDNSGGAAIYESSGAHARILVSATDGDGLDRSDADSANWDLDSGKGLYIKVKDFSGDMDIKDLTFGTDASDVAIGDVFITDLVVTADLNIYGH